MGTYLLLIHPQHFGASSTHLFCTFTLSFSLILGQHSTGLDYQALHAPMEPRDRASGMCLLLATPTSLGALLGQAGTNRVTLKMNLTCQIDQAQVAQTLLAYVSEKTYGQDSHFNQEK